MAKILVLPEAVFEDYLVISPEIHRIISETARQRFRLIQVWSFVSGNRMSGGFTSYAGVEVGSKHEARERMSFLL